MVHPNVIGRCGFILLNSLELLERKREHIDMPMQMKWHHKIPDCKVRDCGWITCYWNRDLVQRRKRIICDWMFSITFYGAQSFSPQHVYGDKRLFYSLSERRAQAAFTLQMETLLPLTTLLKYGKSIAEPIQPPKWLFFCQVIPFIVISNFITINSISHIFHNLVIPVTLVFNIKYILFPLDWKCNYRYIFFISFFF